MEVKVQCACGTRYKFDVEPINDHMPGPVSCPTCGNLSANKRLDGSKPERKSERTAAQGR